MKRILYSIFGLLFILIGCVQNDIPLTDALTQDKENITVRFTAEIPDFTTIHTRANGGVNDLYLLVFDANGSFIVRKKAVLSEQTTTGGTFNIELPSSTQRRIIHFVSNYDWTIHTDSPGVNEAGVVAMMQTDNATFWARMELTNGISENSFNNTTVQLLRNQAKMSVTNDADNFSLIGFAIHNAPQMGTVAPYSLSGGFAEGIITEPTAVSLMSASQSNVSNVEKFLFERKNAMASNITTAIVKGTFGGSTYYYKIDLVDANKNRLDIQRNYHYVVKIKSVTRAGYTNFNDALTGASHNNTALDPIIEKYPMISDGTRKLEVEKTLVVLTQPGQTFQVWAKYFPDATSNTVNNAGVTVALAAGNEALQSTSLHFDPSTGIITATSIGGVLPTEQKEARIVVTNGDLARTIRVILRTPFSFAPVTINNDSPGTITNGQGKDAYLRFQIPTDFPDELFPLPIKIHSQGLYPATTGLELVVENNQIHYIYRATQKGEQSIYLKTNKSDNAETVKLNADYFLDDSVAYRPDKFTISGNIVYNRMYSYWGNQWEEVPNNATVTVTGVTGYTMTITPEGRYTFTLPYDTPGSTSITFNFNRQTHNYNQTITLNNLITTPNLRLDWVGP